MSAGAAPPPAPGLSQEEKDLLAKQGITLDQFNKILQQSTTDSADTQGLLRQLSGLYKQVQVPEQRVAGKKETYSDAKATAYLNSVGGDAVRLRDAGRDRDAARAGDMGIARRYGWIDSQPTEQVIPATTKYELDPTAVNDLKARVATATSQQQQIADLQNKRFITALEGNAPVSQGLIQRKLDDFKALKEGAAKRGILIEGDSPESATSQSSAGNELMGQFNRTYGLLADSERQATLAGGAPDSVGTYGTPVSLASSSGPAGPQSLLAGYSSLGSSYGSALAPYTNQRMLGYNSQLAGYTSGNNRQAGLTGLLGFGGSAALSASGAAKAGTFMAGPWGWGLGAGLMGLGVGSSFL